MHRLSTVAAIVVAALALSACSGTAAPEQPTPYVPPTPPPTAPPWPDGWDSLTCDVMAQFTSTAAHLGAISDAASADDLDTLSTETKGMAADMKTASQDLAALPTWKPAATFVKHVSAAVLHLRKAANLLELGVNTVDAPTVKAGLAELDKGTPELTAATKAGGTLADTYGFGC